MESEAMTPEEGTPSWKDVLSLEERKQLLKIKPLRSWMTVVTNWALVFAAMTLVARLAVSRPPDTVASAA